MSDKKTKKFVPIFGSHIEQVMAREDHSNELVPIIVKHCCQILTSNEEMLKTQGIFRQSSSVNEMKTLQKKYDQRNPDCNFSH